MLESVLPMFSSRSFIVSGLELRSLIDLEFIFVYGVRKCSSFIILQVVDQFSQHHFSKRLSFFPLYILASFVKDKVSIGSWIYLWAFYSVPLICFCLCANTVLSWWLRLCNRVFECFNVLNFIQCFFYIFWCGCMFLYFIR